jgi:polyisoprenoid-binding protein YceI
MKMKIIFFTLIAGTALAFTLVDWTVDTHQAKVEFTATGPTGQVNGSFSGLKATIKFDPDNLLASEILASVEVNTIETGIGLRDKDLKQKKEWFNVVQYPEITIRSKQIQKVGEGYTLTADLTMKGVTKQIDIPFTFTPTGNGGLFKAQFQISRDDFGLGNSAMVGKAVIIKLEVPVNK